MPDTIVATAGPLPVDTPFADARADQLRLRLGATDTPALLARTLDVPGVPGGELLLEVLGSSHRVTLRRDGAADVIETVSCDIDQHGGTDALPADHDALVAGATYAFRSHVEPLGACTATASLADELVASGALVAAFPGHPQAITAVRADVDEPAAVSWRTWHAYPQTDELVVTSTRVTLP